MRPDHCSYRCIVIADDLTGACDSGVEYALTGLRTRIMFSHIDVSEADVRVISTDSRRMSPDAALKHVGKIAASLPLDRVEVVFKKIDSVLRGNIFEESEVIRHAAKACGVVLAPALPAQGRIVEKGILKVKDLTGSWSLDVEQKLREQSARVEKVPIEMLSQRLEDATPSSPYFLCDAISDEDIAFIAKVLWHSRRRSLWIGSAGLAKQSARLLAGGLLKSDRKEKSSRESRNPVLVCIGSDHPVTARQIEYLKRNRNRSCVFFESANIEASDITEALVQNRHLIAIIDMKEPDLVSIGCLFEKYTSMALGGVLISGGDTAALVCRATHARELWLSGQIQNGIAIGCIVGGILDGLPIATKSGGFGQEDSLVDSIDFLTTASRVEHSN